MSLQRRPYLFLLLALAFFCLFYFIENNNDSFLLNDFKVYYEASRELMNGGEPYAQAYGLSSGFFKYSPVTLFLFSPYTLFDFEVAKTLHFILISIVSAWVFVLCLKLCSNYFGRDLSKPSGFMSLLLLLSAVHLTRELHLGNINMFLLLFFLLAISLYQENRLYTSAFFWVLIILLKPYFLLLVLPFFIAKKVKLILLIALYGVVLTFLPALYLGFDGNLQLLSDWAVIMQSHNGGFSEHTFSSIFTAYSGIPLQPSAQFIFIGITALLYLGIRWKDFFGKAIYTAKKLTFDLFVLLALIPNLVITDSQHFLFSLPLIALILAHLKADLKWYLILPFVVAWFFYGANSNDLLGNPLSDKLDTFSTIGVGNLALIVLLVLLNLRANRDNDLIASS